MIEAVKKCDCTGCQMCGDLCPVKAIRYEEENGFWYPIVDKSICINCGLCIKKCPVMAQASNAAEKTYPLVYAAWSADEKERKFSTSGGIYFELARKMLCEGGYIVGVQYTEDFKGAEYAVYNDGEGLARIRNSKYFQADARGVYKKVKDLLDGGEKVLFCGTPCQNEAMVNFLGKSYETLVMVDFICLAVNSPKAHKSYVEYLERVKKSQIKYLHFKHKKNGWNRFGVYAEFENGRSYYKDRYTDLFLRGYLENHLFIRESCEQCRFKSIRHQADLTLGDFWGISPNKKNPNLDFGTSVVICNTPKGEKYLESLGDSVVLYEESIQNVEKGNMALKHSVSRHINANKFLSELNMKPYDKLLKEYGSKRSIRTKLTFVKIYVKHYINRVMGVIRCWRG